MKHLTNLTVALCFCTALTASAQTDTHYATYGSRVMQETLYSTCTGEPYHAYSDTLGQTITVPEGQLLRSVRLTAYDPYSLTDEQATLTLVEGGPYGTVIMSMPIMVPGLNRFFSENELANATYSDVVAKGFYITSHVPSYSFDAVMTEHMLNIPLPTGAYAVLVSVDPTAIHEYVGGGTHAPQIACMSNYGLYPGGHALRGGCAGQGGAMLEPFEVPDPNSFEFVSIDMAFEYTLAENLSTGIPAEPSDFVPVIRYGSLVADAAWNGSLLEVFDAAGRSVLVTRISAGQQYQLPADNVLILRLTDPRGFVRIKKVSVAG